MFFFNLPFPLIDEVRFPQRCTVGSQVFSGFFRENADLLIVQSLPFLGMNIYNWLVVEPPIWKICSSNWVHLPRIIGVNIKSLWENHHLGIRCYSLIKTTYLFAWNPHLPFPKNTSLSVDATSESAHRQNKGLHQMSMAFHGSIYLSLIWELGNSIQFW